jgi:hypothetical protein
MIEIEYDGTSYRYRFGYGDGGYVQDYTSFAKANFFTTAADHIGFFMYCQTGVAVGAVCPEFYRVPISILF